MKVLYISDRRNGGIVSHVKCLTDCLPPEVESYVIGVGGDEEFAGKSGHSIREWFQIRRVIKTFKPDVIHFHTNPLFMELYVKVYRFQSFMVSKFQSFMVSKFQSFMVSRFHGFKVSGLHGRGVAVVCAIHTPSVSKHPEFSRRLVNWAAEPCYWLPVSDNNWRSFKACYPKAKGEVFYNPVRINELERVVGVGQRNESVFIVGMVGRNADQKDWPSFHTVTEKVKVRGEGEQWNVQCLNAGEKEPCNGREAIAKMDLFVMTSKHEELPTTVLECFALGTPICGFLPKGGTSDILQYSNGAVRDVFIEERDCEKLADIVMDLLAHPEKRQALVGDGRQILEGHFDAEKNVKGQLMRVYEKVERFQSF